MDNLNYLYIFIGSLCLSLALTPLCALTAKRLNIIDKPDNNLKRHANPVPYLGGVAIFMSFLIVLIIQRFYTAQSIKGLIGIISGGIIIFLLGLFDDIKKVSVPFKFCVQILTAIILIMCGIKIEIFHNYILNILFTILWIVGVTNAFNLVDIMDGLAGGVAFIAAMTFFFIGILGGKIFSPMAALALSGSVLGFLAYNLPPARIFMGDAGSLFIGFVLATLSITESYSFNNSAAVLLPVIILGFPIFDTLFVMWIRWKKGKPVYFGSPDHVVLRMRKLGLSNKKIIAIIYLICILLSGISFMIMGINVLLTILLYALLLLICLLTANYLSKIH